MTAGSPCGCPVVNPTTTKKNYDDDFTKMKTVRRGPQNKTTTKTAKEIFEAPAEELYEAKTTPPAMPDASPLGTTRVSVPLTQEGKVDRDRLSSFAKEKLKEIYGDAAFRSEIGLSHEDIKAMGFGDDEATVILDFLQPILAGGASAIYKVPYAVTSQAFVFSDLQRSKVSPPLLRVLNKWAPFFLKTWKDEVGLILVFFSCLNAQVRVMHNMEAKRRASLPQQPAKKDNVTPITERPQPPPATEPEKTVAEVSAPTTAQLDMLETVGLS